MVIKMKKQTNKQNFLSCLLSYAKESKAKLILSCVLSIISITLGLVPFYCFYRVICLFLEMKVNGTGNFILEPVGIGSVCC